MNTSDIDTEHLIVSHTHSPFDPSTLFAFFNEPFPNVFPGLRALFFLPLSAERIGVQLGSEEAVILAAEEGFRPTRLLADFFPELAEPLRFTHSSYVVITCLWS